MPRTMPIEEVIIRQSIEVLQSTIEDLCRRRDALAAALPNAPRPAVIKINPVTGREIKQGGGKKRKVTACPPPPEETACDEIAADWVRWHGDLAMFRAEFDEIVRLFDFEHRRGTKRIDLLGIVDQWEEKHGLTVDDFVRLRGEIDGWIGSHMSAFVRIKR